MGWGPLVLYTDRPAKEPGQVMAGIMGHRVSVEVCERVENPDLGYMYAMNSDCDITLYCAFCGVSMCPGCGSEPRVYFTAEGMAASCTSEDCRAQLMELIREPVHGAG